MRNIITIFRKEVNSFFNSLTAYIVLVVFLAGTGLFFWVFGENVLVTWEGRMDALFYFTPWFFLFLIPAITMRSFAEEMKTGTIEFLVTKPLTKWQIIWGKFLSAALLVIFALLPTLLYYIYLQRMSDPPGSMDSGPVWGAYIGLVALGSIFASIGIFSSALTENQVVAFIISVFLSFLFYTGFTFIAQLPLFSNINTAIANIGIEAHFESISRGVLDTRDIIYFISFVAVSLLLTRLALNYKKP